MTADGATSVASKHALLHVSRHVEGLLRLGAGHRRPPQLLALFQDATYFARSARRFARLARVGRVTVAYADRTTLPDGVARVSLDPDEPAAAEWSVIVLGHGVGAALVANETGAVEPADTVERGRTFRFEVTHDPIRLEAHVHRLADELGARLSAATLRPLLDHARALPTDEGRMPDHVAGLHAAVTTAVATTDRVRAGRPGPLLDGRQLDGSLAALHRWAADAGPRTPRLGAVAVRLRPRGGRRGAARLARHARTIVPRGGLLVAPTSDVLLAVLPGTLRDELPRVSERLHAAARDLDPAAVCASGELDPRHLLVGPFLLGLDRISAGGLLHR